MSVEAFRARGMVCTWVVRPGTAGWGPVRGLSISASREDLGYGVPYMHGPSSGQRERAENF